MKNWNNSDKIESKSYVCGHCSNPIASQQGYFAYRPGTTSTIARIYICHHCSNPSFFEGEKQVPGSLYGQKVTGVEDKSVHLLYEESKACITVNAFTASVMCSRKLLMHIAVANGANEGESFTFYVDYLEKKNFTPPNSREWVDHIRKKGNEVNHKITLSTREEATELVDFVGMLLKFIYEFSSLMKSKITPKIS